MSDMPEMYKLDDVADMFRVGRRTVTRWAREGRIPHIKTPGGHCRFPKDAVDRILMDQLEPKSM